MQFIQSKFSLISESTILQTHIDKEASFTWFSIHIDIIYPVL